MTILLTSFKRSLELPEDEEWSKYSTAVFQPKGFNYYPAGGRYSGYANFFDIRLPGGVWVRPRLFEREKDVLGAYRATLKAMYLERWEDWYGDKVFESYWMSQYYDDDPTPNWAFCCWCPYDKAAQRQLKEFGSFVCHTAVVAEVMKEKGFDIKLDKDRERMHLLGAAL